MTDLELYFEYRCEQGLKSRGLADKEEYRERLKFEIGVIKQMHYCGYFLIVSDFLTWAINQGIPVGPGRGCFLPGSKVKLSDGSVKTIEEIKVGDIVISHDNTHNEVTCTQEYEANEEVVELEFENGSIVQCTLDHKILTKNRGWVEARHLTENDDIVTID